MARILLCPGADGHRPALDIALSERNLIVLLSKLYTPGSRCSFANGDVPAEFAYATFRAEPDEYHYASPTRDGNPPGPMHPVAEMVHAAIKDLLHEAAAAAARPAGVPRSTAGGFRGSPSTDGEPG